MKIVSNDFKAKTLVSCVNSLAHLMVRLRFNKCGGGTTRAKTKRDRVANIAQSKDKVITSTHVQKICFVSSSS
jgi:hypothetical protein